MKRLIIPSVLLGILFLAIITNVYLFYSEVKSFCNLVVKEETEKVKSIVEGTLTAGGDPIEAISAYMQKSPFLKGATFSLEGREVIIPGSSISSSYIKKSFKASMLTFTLYFDFSALHIIKKRVVELLLSLFFFTVLFTGTLLFFVREYFKEKIRYQKELQEKERLESINLVIHSILHEVKNRLNTMRLLVYKIKSGEKREFAELLEEELNKLGNYIEETAELRRPVKVEFKSVDVSSLILSVVSKFEEVLKRFDIQLEISVEPCRLEVDEEKFSSVITDLLKNAIEAIQNLEKRIIKIEGKKEKNEYRILIKDSGGKIETSDLFKPFVSTKKKGLGLGLYNAKRIVEAHQGSIKAYTKKGWTVFEIILPLK
ncbi:MAG: GHKL domain-containing protein [Thermodesulfobacteria bacterium]|nr:GHKL domain-containing protein [Thermodesulfobacteriota bacterium]